MLRHLLAFLRPGDDQPATKTYYRPRPRANDPQPIPTATGQAPADARRALGDQLPAGFDWAPSRPVLTVILGGDPTAQGPDEVRVRNAMIRAINGKGAAA